MSRFLIEDIRSLTVRPYRIITTPTGVWAIAIVLNPTDDEDRYRAYPNSDLANATGLIATCGSTADQVIAAARNWS